MPAEVGVPKPKGAPRKPYDENMVVEKLLQKLPFADPTLKSDPDTPATVKTPRPAPGVKRPVTPARGALVSPKPAEPPWKPLARIWGRVGLGVGYAVALTQWPYASQCGWLLWLYLTAVFFLLLAGAWGALGAWKHRFAAAHVLSLIVVFWGIVLAAEQILPRVGYARQAAAWVCR